MRTVPYVFQGKTYFLLLNANAFFDICDIYGARGFITDHIRGGDRESLENTCFFLAKLAEQGELYRRYPGYDRGPVPAKALFLRGLSPAGVLRAKAAVFQAVAAGFSRQEAPEQKEIDVGLLELQRNSEPALTRGRFLNAAMEFLRLDFHEAMLLPMGLVYDLIELELRRRGVRKEK